MYRYCRTPPYSSSKAGMNHRRRKYKKFDCVKMKWDIQKKIAKEFAGVPEEEAHRIQAERIHRDPILGPMMKRIENRLKNYRKATG